MQLTLTADKVPLVKNASWPLDLMPQRQGSTEAFAGTTGRNHEPHSGTDGD